MRILFVLSRYPHPSFKGDKLRAFHQIRMLSQNNEVHLIALNPEKPKAESLEILQKYCQSIQVIQQAKWRSYLNLLPSPFISTPFQVSYFKSSEMYKAIEKTVKEKNIELIFAQLVRVVENVPKGLNAHYHLDYMDAMSANMERRYHHSASREKRVIKSETGRLRKYEQAVADRFDTLSVISQPDAIKIGGGNLKDQLHVIPNGISEEFLNYGNKSVHDGEEKKYDVIFTGNMGYHPNIQACKYLIKDLKPMVEERYRPIKICLAGTSPSDEVKKLASENVEVTGFLPDLKPYLANSKVFVAPLFSGSGLQNKLLESMAMGLPTLTTHLANGALKAKPKEEILVCNDKETFTKRIIQLLEDPQQRKQIGTQGKKYVKANFSWDTFNQQLELLFKAST